MATTTPKRFDKSARGNKGNGSNEQQRQQSTLDAAASRFAAALPDFTVGEQYSYPAPPKKLPTRSQAESRRAIDFLCFSREACPR
jgi:hypothetical protein